MYKLSNKSRNRMAGVKERLVNVVENAIQITKVDFTVLEGIRSEESQLKLWKTGASKLNGIPKNQVQEGIEGTGISSHQTGDAVDLGAYVLSSVRWDWSYYFDIARAMREAAINQEVLVIWGGVWDYMLNHLSADLEKEMAKYATRRIRMGFTPFHDGPHFQLALSK